MDISIKVNTADMNIEAKKELRNKLQKIIDELTVEIRHQHIIRHKHNK